MLFLNPDGTMVLETFDIVKVMVLTGFLFIIHWLMRNTSVKEVSTKI